MGETYAQIEGPEVRPAGVVGAATTGGMAGGNLGLGTSGADTTTDTRKPTMDVYGKLTNAVAEAVHLVSNENRTKSGRRKLRKTQIPASLFSRLVDAAAKHFGVDPDMVLSASRGHRITAARRRVILALYGEHWFSPKAIVHRSGWSYPTVQGAIHSKAEVR